MSPTSEYPKYKYSPTEPPRLVQNAEEEALLGEGWYDSPEEFPPPPPPGETPVDAEQSEQLAVLTAEVATLTTGQATLTAEVATLTTGQATLATNVTALQTEQAALRAEVDQLKLDVAAITPPVTMSAEAAKKNPPKK